MMEALAKRLYLSLLFDSTSSVVSRSVLFVCQVAAAAICVELNGTTTDCLK